MEPLEADDPRVVGPYRLTYRLGSGGMGRVYLGESPGGRRVAVKLVREDLASSPGFRERFRREAKLAMRAGGFWAAQVVDADPDAARPWIASQYVDGPSLAERVARQGPLDEQELRRTGGGLAEALASFHRAGLVHRDLKPSNVLLQADGPRVIDFGVSKALEPLDTAGAIDLTRAGTILGTPGFMAPEQALGKPAGPPADVFSLGSLLVHAATGAGPFGTGASHALLYRVVYEEPELAGVPYGLRQLIADCLRKEPAERPTAEALVPRLAGAGPRPRGVPDPRVAVAAEGPVGPAGPVGPVGVPAGASVVPAELPEEKPAEQEPAGEEPAGETTAALRVGARRDTGPDHGTSGWPAKLTTAAGRVMRIGRTGRSGWAGRITWAGRIRWTGWAGRARPVKRLTQVVRGGRITRARQVWRSWRRTRRARPAGQSPGPAADDAVGFPRGTSDDGLTVGEWGPAAFRRRMRHPLRLALGIDVVIFLSELAKGGIRPSAFGSAFTATLVCVLAGLWFALPLRRPRAVQVGPDGLSVLQGRHRLTVPWRDVADVRFARRNRREIAVTATLDEAARTAVPQPLTGAGGALTCTVALPVRGDAADRSRGLDSALRAYAGDRYRSW